MAQVGETGFELERFGWTEPGRLEVRGRWSGIHGRRLGRPTLTLEAHGRRTRLSALPDASAAPVEDEDWQVAFPFAGTPDDVTAAELEIGRRLVVELPRPRRSRRLREQAEPAPASEPAASPLEAVERLRSALTAREHELTALRAEVDRLAEADEAQARLMVELSRARDALSEDEAERERLASDAAQLRADLALRDGELAGLREEAQAALDDSEQRLLAEQRAASDARAEVERLAAALAAASEEAERLRADLAATEEETEQLRADLGATTEEADRLRAELAAVQEEAARLRAAHDPTTVPLPVDLPTTESRDAAPPAETAEPPGAAAADEDPAETEERPGAVAAHEQPPPAERAPALDQTQPTVAFEWADAADPPVGAPEDASTDEHDLGDAAVPDREASWVERGRAIAARRRLTSPSQPERAASSAEGNGGTATTEEAPVPVTPAARAAAVRRTEATRTVAQPRVVAARAVASHRVHEAHRSSASVWAARVAAFALVALLLLALLIIVGMLA